MEDLKERVLKVEIELEGMHRSVEALSTTATRLERDISGIQKNLTQIKWFALGAVALLSIDKLGLLNLVKLMFGGI
jgi:hypothetical protein